MKIVVITGGSRGIGRSAAHHCARAGMGVVLTYRERADSAAAVVREIEAAGGTAAALPLDVGDCAGFGDFRTRLQATLAATWNASHIDALVNNAGHGLFNPIAAVSEAEFDALVAVHLKGPFFLTQALLPLIADGGQILNLSSATTRVATAGVAPYAACKGGLEVLTRYMAKEFGDRRIRANAIAPGAIRTELGGGIPAPFETLLASQTALGRIGEPDDVGRVIAGMLAGEMGWINAQTIEVAGGYQIWAAVPDDRKGHSHMAEAIEITSFQLVRGKTFADFLAANTGMTAWLAGQPGFVSRELAESEDGTIVDLLRWASPAAATAAAERMLHETRDSPVHGMIDHATVTWHIAEVRIRHG